jgi:serine/threonine-protein kinase HipA
VTRAIAVHIGGFDAAIGTLRYDRDGRREHAAFTYTEDWLAHAKRFAVDPSLPLVSGFQFPARRGEGSVFHGAIADTEPDGWGRRLILRDHAKRRQQARAAGETPSLQQLGELDFLLAVDDESRVGALRFRDEDGIFQGTSADGARRTPPLLELGQLLAASRAVELSEETAADLEYLRGRGTSLGGLRPKCSVRDDDGHLAIAKFPSAADERAVTKGEVLALELARRTGIDAAPARIVMSDGVPVTLVRRFDRTADARRLPYVSASTMLGAERGDPTEHTYTEIVDAIRVHGHRAQADIEELFRRIAFSIAINNVDDHLQNHGFLHVAHDQWRLSPAFDINPFPERVRELKTWISEDTGPEASQDALLSTGAYFGLSNTRAKEIIDGVVTTVVTWWAVGTQLGMTETELEAYSPAFD